MTLDEKLKQLREATDALAPSASVLAAIEAAVAGEPAAPSTRSSPGTTTAVKVLIVAVAVGVLGWAVVRPLYQGWTWFGRSSAPVTRHQIIDGGASPCPPQQGNVAVLVQPPGTNRVDPREEQLHRERVSELLRQLKVRPPSCEAQKAPIDELLQLYRVSAATAKRLVTRRAFFCGPSGGTPAVFPAAQAEPCDDSEWCRAPRCSLSVEDCARAWAAFPANTCVGRAGRLGVTHAVCVRFLHGEASEDQVRTASLNAWCLEPQALQERALLLTPPAKERP